MKKIITPKEMYDLDAFAINDLAIESKILMENAGHSSSSIILECIRDNQIKVDSIAILCGVGNNGGDGLVIARYLSQFYRVSNFLIGNLEKLTSDTDYNLQILKNLSLEITYIDNEEDLQKLNSNYSIYIDALIGIGGSEDISGLIAKTLEHIADINSLKIAIDVPTGLNPLNGKAYEYCFKADLTITMYAIKLGMLINEGSEYAGEIKIANLGVPKLLDNFNAKYLMIDKDNLPKKNVNILKKQTHKYDYGVVSIIAGSKDMNGAGALAANACIKSGAGLVYLITEKSHNAILPEIICIEQSYDVEFSEFTQNALEKSDVILIGPGLGNSNEILSKVDLVLSKYLDTKIIILDADAIKSLDSSSKYNKNLIITPHLGEFSKLINLSKEHIIGKELEFAEEYAEKMNCNILLKGFPTLITDGSKTILNQGGNNGMATAGSGDVLAGIIAGMMMQFEDKLEATALAAYLHSLASDLYYQKNNRYSLSASTIIKNLEQAINEIKPRLRIRKYKIHFSDK